MCKRACHSAVLQLPVPSYCIVHSPKLSVLSKRHTTCPQYSTLLQSIADVLLPKDGATTADSRADAALLEKRMNSTVTVIAFDPSSVALSEAMGATSTLLL